MTDYVSHLLAANAAKRRLAELFESKTSGSADHSPTTMVGEGHRAARINSKQNNNTAEEYSSQGWPLPHSTRSAIPAKKAKRDLTLSGLVLALVFSGAVAAAHTDRPVFWLLVGPAPFTVVYTVGVCLRHRLIRREGLLTFSERNR